MILVAVGTQFPFDRLVRTVDDWATANGRNDVVAQIGPSAYVPKTLKAFAFLGPEEFRDLQASATVIISHAGMGSILTALEHQKPIIIMPRDHRLGEHRNAHQMATVERFKDKPGVHAALNEAALVEHLNRVGELGGATDGSPSAPPQFTAKLREFIGL